MQTNRPATWLWILACLALAGCGGSGNAGGASLRSQAEKLKKIPNPEVKARKLAKLGNEQFKAGDVSGAVETLAASVNACEAIKDPILRTGTLTYVARAEALSDNRTQAADLLRQARALADKIDNIEVRTSALAEIGGAQGKELHDATAATDTLKVAEGFAGQIADVKAKAMSQVEIAQAYLKLGQTDQAERLLGSALAEAKAIAEPAKRAQALGEVASAQDPLLPKGAPREAFDAAVAAARDIEQDYNRVIALTDLAGRLVDTGHRSQAGPLIEEAKSLLPKINEVDLHKEADERIYKAEHLKSKQES